MNTGQGEIDLDYLNTMSGGDADMRATLLAMLIDELPREASILHDAGQRGDVAAIFQASHSLKSTLAYTGHAEAIRPNNQIEETSRQGKWSDEDQEQLAGLLVKISELIAGLTRLQG